MTTVHRSDGSEEKFLDIGGLNSDEGQHIFWHHTALNLGDKLSITVIDDLFDPPVSNRKPLTEEEIRADKIRYYHELRAELKDYLNE